jgi:anti-sigma factor RsiW
MSACGKTREAFSSYLDGALSGREMQATAAHLERCEECAAEFSEWRQMHEALYRLGPAKAPADLALRLRIAVSKERGFVGRTPCSHLCCSSQRDWSARCC